MPLSPSSTANSGEAHLRPLGVIEGASDAEVLAPVGNEPPSRRMATANLRNEELNTKCRAWLARIAAGDAPALEDLYHATLPWLWALARKVLGNDADVEDVLSDVYHQVWRESARYDPDRSPPMAWLTMICRSRAIDHLRRRDTAFSFDEIENLVSEAGEADIPQQVGLQREAQDSDPQRALGWRQECSGLEAALACLPAVERQLILLAYFRDMSQTELAETLGMPLGTVKSRTRRALAELRRQLTVGVM